MRAPKAIKVKGDGKDRCPHCNQKLPKVFYNRELIFSLRSKGLTLQEIADQIGCSTAHAHHVLNGRKTK